MVKISRTDKKFDCLKTSSLAAANILERYDLQEYIFNSPQAFCKEVGQELTFVGKEVCPSEEVSDRIDLLAIDHDGDCVIIELKRGDDKLQLLQAVSYAGMIAKLSPAQILAFAGKDQDAIAEFVHGESEINHGQRILLVAEEYDYEVLVAAEWLYERDVEIDCVRVALAVDGTSEYLTFTQIFPTPELAEQARKRGRARNSNPIIDSSWEEALAKVSNEAVTGFFKRHIDANVDNKLRYREIEFGPERRIHVLLHDSYASVEQYCGRFVGDIEFWQSRTGQPTNTWTKRHKDDCLRFRLSTAEDFAAFEKAVGELKATGWSNAPVDVIEVAGGKGTDAFSETPSRDALTDQPR
jgi:hypothetical protein